MNEQIDTLVETLRRTKDKNVKAVLVEVFIATYGPIPNERGEEVRQAILGE